MRLDALITFLIARRHQRASAFQASLNDTLQFQASLNDTPPRALGLSGLLKRHPQRAFSKSFKSITLARSPADPVHSLRGNVAPPPESRDLQLSLLQGADPLDPKATQGPHPHPTPQGTRGPKDKGPKRDQGDQRDQFDRFGRTLVVLHAVEPKARRIFIIEPAEPEPPPALFICKVG